MAMSGLFRIECLVDAKQLGAVLMVLAGKVRSMSPPQPVVERPSNSSGGVPMLDLFADWLRKHKFRTVNVSMTREFLREHGRREGNATYLLGTARNAGMLRHNGGGPHDSRWVVLASKKRP